jgi:IS30 family transposase
MKGTKIMSDTEMNAAKQQLRRLTDAYQRPLRGKFAVLMPLRQEIIELDRKGASGGEIAALLAQCQITVSKDTVGRFLRQESKAERNSHAKKTGPAPQASGNDGQNN